MARALPAAAVLLGAFAAVAVAAQARTTVVAFAPFAADGALRPGLLGGPPAASASCTTGSFVVASTAAHRCATGPDIRDPCWLDLAASAPGAPVVACLSAPWRRDVLRLHVPLNELRGDGGAPAGSPPWALALTSGLRCLAAQGASPRVHGRRLRYRCPGPRYLFGRPDTTRATWRIRVARTAGGAGERTVSIRRAWR